MNFLNIRKGPKMEFIVGEHRNEFERDVLDIATDTDLVRGFWGVVPSLEKDVLENIPSKYALAGLMGEIHEDPSYYHKQTHGKMIPSYEEYWALANLNQYAEVDPAVTQIAMVRTAGDAYSVLNYHHVFCAVTMAPGPGTGVQGFCNIPVTNVW